MLTERRQTSLATKRGTVDVRSIEYYIHFQSTSTLHLHYQILSITTMSNMKAIKIVSAGKAEIQDVPKPELLEDRVLVKVNAVALNPTDW